MFKKLSFIVILVMLLHLFSVSTIAETEVLDEIITEENIQLDGMTLPDDVLDETSLAEGQSTRTSTDNWVWATANKNTAIVSAPYDGLNTTIATLNSGDGFYIIERDYGYFYVNKTVNGKFRRGYIKMADVNYSSYEWVSHNIFQKGKTKFTASSQQVLSGPGTINSYENIGSIYQGEDPLLILRQETNTYNNVKYSFIQYKVTGTSQFKRGWVPSSAVQVVYANSDDEYIDVNKIFYFESAATNKMMQAASTTSGSYVTQQPKVNSGAKQLFKIEAASSGYYRFILQSNTKLSLQVLGNQMSEGARIGVATKGTTNSPTKAEEFEVKVTPTGEFHLKSRCTGLYRTVDLYSGSAANGTKIISSLFVDGVNQRWRFQPKILGGDDVSIIKVGDSTGRACVSVYNAFDKVNVYYANPDCLESSTNTSKNTKFTLPHVKFAIKNSSVFYINGHGWPTPRIGGDNITPSYDITPSNIGFTVDDRTQWGILGPCNQLNRDGSAIDWANYALRNGVKGILGYYDIAPHDNGLPDDPQVVNMATFADKIENGTSFLTAWKQANDGILGYNGQNWAAIYHEEAEDDNLENYNDNNISSPNATTIRYVGRFVFEGDLDTSALRESNVINGNEPSLTAGVDKETAVNIVAEYMQEHKIIPDSESEIQCGVIKRWTLSKDGKSFVDEEILAYTFVIDSNEKNGNSSTDMYFEVDTNGDVEYIAY